MREIVVFGSGGHAKVVIDVIEKQGEYSIAGLIDDRRPPGETLLGYRILGGAADISHAAKGITTGIVAVGDNWQRHLLAENILELQKDFEFITAIHPFTAISRDVEIGPGTVVMAGVVINSGSRIGRHCILNTRCSLDHDNSTGDFATVGPGAVTGGNVAIGEFSTLALGASAIHGVKIGPHTVIGAGSCVLKDVEGRSVAFGCPARRVRERKEGEKYL